MSPRIRDRRHAKQLADRAIGEAYRRLSADRRARRTFTTLLHHVRDRAPSLLHAPLIDEAHPGVEALVNLSRAAHPHIRPIAEWPGSDAGWQGAIAALAQHLVARYRVPRFLAAAWYARAATDPFAEAKRRWYVTHANGLRFRALDLPMRMSKRMEHLFLQSPDATSIEQAMRRAELFALRADATLVDAVLATHLGRSLEHGAFWRTFLHLLVTQRNDVELDRIDRVVDFLDLVRHGRLRQRDVAPEQIDPPAPALSLAGRTWSSLRLLMWDWFDGKGDQFSLHWEPSKLQLMTLETPGREPGAAPTRLEFVELTTLRELQAEGTAMQHCVGSYGWWCYRNESRIFSLRARGAKRPLATIEVDLAERAIDQVRGYRNRRPPRVARDFVRLWAVREGLANNDTRPW